MIDRAKSLQELDGDAWGESTLDSHLVATCHRLRRKPIKEFTVEDLRIMVGQSIGLEFLVPIAIEIEILEINLFAEGDLYPGDLLEALISGSPPQFWSEHSDLARRLDAVLRRAMENLSMLGEIDRKNLVEALNEVSWQIEQIRKAAKAVAYSGDGPR
jgi:hypothetical protein